MSLLKGAWLTASTLLLLLLQPLAARATTPLSIPPTVTSTGHQNDKLVAAGYLDVTIYGADSTGNTDSTAQLQQAINDGINYSMDVYVPPGTYSISKTLKGLQDCNDTTNYKFGSISRYGTHKAPSLMGPAIGTRPTIVLKDGSAGFSDSTKPQPLIYFINTTANATTGSCSSQWLNSTAGAFDILYYATIRDINVKTGNNAGAIGVRFFSAQYSYMQNVSVDARGGFVGIQGAPATEVWTNIEVNGGSYGVVMDQGVCGTSAVAGLTLENQTVAGLSTAPLNGIGKAICGAVTITGFNFQESGIPAVSIGNAGEHATTLDLIDGSMTIAAGSQSAVNNPAGESVYMNNVYVKAPSGVKLISNNTSIPPAAGAVVISPTASGGWDYFQEYAHDDSGTYDTSFGGGVPVNGYNVIADVKSRNDFNSSSFRTNGSAPPTDLVARNVPGQSPWALDSNAVWVTDYGADPTGKSDSTTAIRNAIAASVNNGDQIFLPRGVYNITGTLNINPNTILFGIPGQLSVLNGSAWVTHAQFQPFVQSANSKTGTAMISDLNINLPSDDGFIKSYCDTTLKDCTLFPAGFSYDPYDNTYLNALNWQVGRNSVLNQLGVNMQWDATTDLPSAARKLIQVSAGGGGRWYGLQMNTAHANDPTKNNNFRALTVTGTTEPLTLYGSNPEHMGGQTFYEFSGAGNIRVLGLKSESGDNSQLMWLENGTNNVLITGINGDCGACWFLITGSSNISLANLAYYGARDNQTSSAKYITDDTTSFSVNDAYALYKLGNFDDTVFSLPSSSPTSFSVTANPNPVTHGQTVTFTGNLSPGVTVSNAHVTLWFYNSAGGYVGSATQTGLNFTAGSSTPVSIAFTAPGTAGTYTYNLTVYNSSGATQAGQVNDGSFTVR